MSFHYIFNYIRINFNVLKQFIQIESIFYISIFLSLEEKHISVIHPLTAIRDISGQCL